MAETTRQALDFAQLFDTEPSHLAPYRYPERVSRESFAAFLSRSFLASRGELDRQALYIAAAQVQAGTDYFRILHDFIGHGGWHILTTEEQRLLDSDFERVAAHHREHMSDQLNGWRLNPAYQLYHEIQGLLVISMDYESLLSRISDQWSDTEDFATETALRTGILAIYPLDDPEYL